MKPKFNWRDSFVSYDEASVFYIYCDTNASYASIHQYLEDGMDKACVVANGNTKDAGACLAISYEARAKGIGRGASLQKALGIHKDILVYESCLPLYELYADLYDQILSWIVPREMFYRGSCDEVVISYKYKDYPYRKFWTAVHSTLSFISEQLGKDDLRINISAEQEADILEKPSSVQAMYAICYLVRDCIKQLLGLPISIAVAPSICLGKALIERSKPQIVNGKKVYRTFHEAIAFPYDREEANGIYRPMSLRDLCGVQTIARRLEEYGLSQVKSIQDYCDLEQSIRLSKNLHLGKVVWYMCHGRDDVLSGYLSAIRDRK